LFIVRKEHIRAFAEAEDSISPKQAQFLLELVSVASEWDDVPVDGCKRDILEGKYVLTDLAPENTRDVEEALGAVKKAKPFPVPQLPGSVVRQRVIVEEIEQDLKLNPITQVTTDND
jgi:hypothetical protein